MSQRSRRTRKSTFSPSKWDLNISKDPLSPNGLTFSPEYKPKTRRMTKDKRSSSQPIFTVSDGPSGANIETETSSSQTSSSILESVEVHPGVCVGLLEEEDDDFC